MQGFLVERIDSKECKFYAKEQPLSTEFPLEVGQPISVTRFYKKEMEFFDILLDEESS